MKCKTLVGIVLVVLVGVGIGLRCTTPEVEYRDRIEIHKPRWWGKGEPKEVDSAIRPFKVDVDESLLKKLKSKLEQTTYFDPIEESDIGWEYGIPPNVTKDLVNYWLNDYDWRKHEKTINQFDHFKTNIDGIDVHFMHIKAKNNKNPKPLLLVHGWPGSVVEFLDIIPMLTNPSQFGGDDEQGWDLVVPSLPGYGFSGRPHKSGFNAAEAALLLSKLMRRLGYNKFAYQGGDWGALIGYAMTRVDPDGAHCVAVHVNMVVIPTTPLSIVQMGIAALFPNYYSPKDTQKMHPGKMITHMLKESGYLHLQATRPYTVGTSLTDSPAGLMAYIVEKFHSWADHNGDLYGTISKDQLLTNVMIYYVTNTISSSVAFYKENAADFADLPNRQNFPIAIAEFKDIFNPPRTWAENYFSNLISYTEMEKGGHFAAMEQPLLLAKDIWKFNKIITWW